MNFYRSLAIAGGVTGTVLAAVVVTGLLTNDSMDLEVGSGDPRTMRIQAIPVRLGGHGLKPLRATDEIAVLSISLTVSNATERDLVCRLAPRLIAAVTQNVGQRYTDHEVLARDLDKVLPTHLRRQFNRALKAEMIETVSILKLEPDEPRPRATCGPGS